MNNRISEKVFDIENLSQGFNILREYIWYYNLNLIYFCQSKDPRNEGLIKKEDFRKMISEELRNMFYLTIKNIQEIFRDSPRVQNKEKGNYVKYAVLQNMIKNGPKPTTGYCIPNIICLRKFTPEDA